LFLLAAALLFSGCANSLPPIRTEAHVDLNRFMGDWYVIANIPTFVEKDAYNAVESYRMGEDGVIYTTFRFNKGGFDGKLKTYHPKGFVRDRESNALWAMQFVWPVKSEYRIVYVSEDYGQTIIGRSKRDYVWIMARTPQIPEADYRSLLEIVKEAGYDVSKVQRVPQAATEPTAGPGASEAR